MSRSSNSASLFILAVAGLGIGCGPRLIEEEHGLHWHDAPYSDTAAPVLDTDAEQETDETCEISCSCSGGSLSVGLSCGTGSVSCSYGYNSSGQVSSMSCSYSNGADFSCSVSYNSLGQASGTCTTYEDGYDSCSFSC